MRKAVVIGFTALAMMVGSFALPPAEQPFSIVQQTEARSVYVKGYTKKNGTYVQPHYRSAPDGNPYNNYSFPGNVNPHTGKVAPGNPDTYLRNYGNNGDSFIPSTPSFPSYSGKYDSPSVFCGLYSTWNPVTTTCECQDGYTKSGTRCVSPSEKCDEELGYGSKVDSSGECSCRSGYVLKDGKCTFSLTLCGLMETYNEQTGNR